jgi:hypothetical protein
MMSRNARQQPTTCSAVVPASSTRPRNRPPQARKLRRETPATLFNNCVDKRSKTLHTLVTYQPASRFWPFQWAETGDFLGAALALCGLTSWWLRREYA